MQRLHALSLASALLLAAAPLQAQWRDGYSEERDASARAAGASRVDVRARAGTLRIQGRDGLDEIRARGTARASSRALLREVELVVERRGGTVLVEVVTPDDLRDREWAALDLELEVPRDLLLDVSDGSGELSIRGVGALRLEDGSGSLTVEDVGGDVRIVDGSGSITVAGVRGDLQLEDGSGSTEISDVRGTVTVPTDGSGSLTIREVGRSVRVGSKGSGSLRVANVRGDLTVERKSSGSIRYEEVDGRVDVPSRGRRGPDWRR